MKTPAAFFDMDRTVLRVNSGMLYVQWMVRRGELRRRDIARAALWLAKYKFGLADIEAIVKSASVGVYGRDEAEFRRATLEWVHSEVIPEVAALARQEIDDVRARGIPCVLLTSSTPYAAEPLAEAVGIAHVLCTRLEVSEGRFTGDVIRPLCYGPGKVALAEKWADENDVDLAQSLFYTDSVSDLPMLERVGVPIAVNPDPRLRFIAWRRGWRTTWWD